MRYFISLLLLFAFAISLKAQENCAENLIKANSLYDKGEFAKAIELLTPCTQSTLKTDQWQAYRLLAMSYLANFQPEEARTSAEKMLEMNPTYTPNLRFDPADFIKLLKQINIIPKFSLGLSFVYGGNIAIPQITGFYAPSNYEKNYKNKGGFQLGLLMGYNLSKNSALHLNMISISKRYSIDYQTLGKSVKIDEVSNSIDLPILYSYNFYSKNRLKFGVIAGPYLSVLINSYNNLSLSDSSGTMEVKRYSSKVRRNALNYGICGGIGMTYKLKSGHFSLDARYYKSMSNITKTDGRYDNATLIYDYSYLDDDIRLDNIAISLGYHLYINYKIIK
jgi:tetratricopeptide (TPR) repeat protein